MLPVVACFSLPWKSQCTIRITITEKVEENTADITQAPFTSDPYGWVDPVTDRVFNIHMMGLATTWIG